MVCTQFQITMKGYDTGFRRTCVQDRQRFAAPAAGESSCLSLPSRMGCCSAAALPVEDLPARNLTADESVNQASKQNAVWP